MRAAHSRKAAIVNIYSGVPFTMGLVLMAVTWAMVVTGHHNEKLTDGMYKVAFGLLIAACLASPVGWFFDIPMYQGFFGIAAAGVPMLLLLGLIDYRQRKEEK